MSLLTHEYRSLGLTFSFGSMDMNCIQGSDRSVKSVKKISVSEVSEFFGNVRFWGVFGIQNLKIFDAYSLHFDLI